MSLLITSVQERGWDSLFRPWSLSLAVFGRWRCACWWPLLFSPWPVAGACVWVGAGTWGKPAVLPPWHCKRISEETNWKKKKENRTDFRPVSLSKYFDQENKTVLPQGSLILKPHPITFSMKSCHMEKIVEYTEYQAGNEGYSLWEWGKKKDGGDGGTQTL